MTLVEFGRFDYRRQRLAPNVPVFARNGWGKTTLINAYIFALSGKTLRGFEPRNVNAVPTRNTEVIIEGLFSKPLRRTLAPTGGTTLYLGADVITQKALEEAINVKLLCALADTNILCEGSLTSEQLRTLLCVTDVMDGDERVVLEKRLKALRDALKQAESRAVTVVTIPPSTLEPLTGVERRFCDEFNKRMRVPEPMIKCPTCGKDFSEKTVRVATAEYEAAQAFCSEYKESYDALCEKHAQYEAEQRDIETAKRIIEATTQARKDVIDYREQIAQAESELREYDASAIRASLPEDVTLVTESQTKQSTSKPVCTLSYRGVPLKSVNRARRVRICLDLLDAARIRAGLNEYPIWVDNAECVEDLHEYNDIIAFYVTQI